MSPGQVDTLTETEHGVRVVTLVNESAVCRPHEDRTQVHPEHKDYPSIEGQYVVALEEANSDPLAEHGESNRLVFGGSDLPLVVTVVSQLDWVLLFGR